MVKIEYSADGKRNREDDAFETEVPEFVVGDINGDGALDVQDALRLFCGIMLPEVYPLA